MASPASHARTYGCGATAAPPAAQNLSSSLDASSPPAPAQQPPQQRKRVDLFVLNRDRFDAQLDADLGPSGWTRGHSAILWGFIHRCGKTTLNMKNIVGIRRDLREQLAQRYTLNQGRILTHHTSEDGTRKFLLQFAAGQEVESVFIPEPTRGTLCVSSQMRNLTTSEIVSQVIHAKRVMNDFPTMESLEMRKLALVVKRRRMRQNYAHFYGKMDRRHEGKAPPPQTYPSQEQEEMTVPEEPRRTVTNIVFMGQGEPLYNYRNVVEAIRIISNPSGLSIGQPKITLSTSGVVPNIYRLAEDTKVNLAISLHAANNQLRDELVPINKQYPLEQLFEACRFFLANKKKRIMFEYVMLKDVNDREKDAVELTNLLAGFPHSLINLIPFNPWPGTKYECSSDDQIMAFHKILTDHQLNATVRWPRGRDIMAACGQLKTHHDRVKSQGASNSNSAAVPLRSSIVLPSS